MRDALSGKEKKNVARKERKCSQKRLINSNQQCEKEGNLRDLLDRGKYIYG